MLTKSRTLRRNKMIFPNHMNLDSILLDPNESEKLYNNFASYSSQFINSLNEYYQPNSLAWLEKYDFFKVQDNEKMKEYSRNTRHAQYLYAVNKYIYEQSGNRKLRDVQMIHSFVFGALSNKLNEISERYEYDFFLDITLDAFHIFSRAQNTKLIRVNSINCSNESLKRKFYNCEKKGFYLPCDFYEITRVDGKLKCNSLCSDLTGRIYSAYAETPWYIYQQYSQSMGELYSLDNNDSYNNYDKLNHFSYIEFAKLLGIIDEEKIKSDNENVILRNTYRNLDVLEIYNIEHISGIGLATMLLKVFNKTKDNFIYAYPFELSFLKDIIDTAIIMPNTFSRILQLDSIISFDSADISHVKSFFGFSNELVEGYYHYLQLFITVFHKYLLKKCGTPEKALKEGIELLKQYLEALELMSPRHSIKSFYKNLGAPSKSQKSLFVSIQAYITKCLCDLRTSGDNIFQSHNSADL